MNFEDLNIKPEIVKALKELGLNSPTAIQEKAIPLINEGKDLIGTSETGSGKTAAFGIPALEKLSKNKRIQLLIMAPTRELAVQIAKDLQKMGKYLGLTIAAIYGGVGYQPQETALSQAEVVVGTPGRLLDHLNRRNIDFSNLNCVVLDEADKMVEMGFIEDITEIMDHLPAKKQVLLFGATLSREIDRIKEKYMHQPAEAEAGTQVDEEFLKQYYYDVQPQEKFSLLVHLLKTEKTDRVIVFCSARVTVGLVTANLRSQSIKAEMIHGKLSQSKRLQVIERFNQGKINILVASPVAARGLHIEDISHVINYDLSPDAQEYIHRIGRTARAGRKGKAITLLSCRDYDTFNEILARHRVPVEELPKGHFPRLRFDTGRSFGPGRRDFSRSSYPQRHPQRSYPVRQPPQPRSREMSRKSIYAPSWA